jgi:hypothetical protein
MHICSPLRLLKLTLLAIEDYVLRDRSGDSEVLGPILPGVFPRFIRSGYKVGYFNGP